LQVATFEHLPEAFSLCSLRAEEVVRVIASVSAAVPAPQQKMFGAMKWILEQFLSATIGPEVARVSAPRITPSYKGERELAGKRKGNWWLLTLKMRPAIVVPVFVAFKGAEPWLRPYKSNENPMMPGAVRGRAKVMMIEEARPIDNEGWVEARKGEIVQDGGGMAY
jgi:hypothetical protein